MDFRCVIDVWQRQFDVIFLHIVSHMGITLTNVGSIINEFYIPRGKIYRPRPSASVCKFLPPWGVKSIDDLASIRQ